MMTTMDEPPSPPLSSASVSPKLPSQLLGRDEPPSKKQKRDTPPLTPPRSAMQLPSRLHSPTPPPLSCRTGFTSLPFSLQEQIVALAAWNSSSSYGYGDFLTVNTAGHYAPPEGMDCRFANLNLALLLEMRVLLANWCGVSKAWDRICRPMLTKHCVVTNMYELWAVAGVEYVAADGYLADGEKGKEHAQPPSPLRRSCVYEECTASEAWPGRVRLHRREATRVKDLIVWMARLPSEEGSLQEETRWPKWYLQDHMRYELEALGVERIVILAPHQASAANALHATLPNRAITHLRIEVQHSLGPIWAQSPKFVPAYFHQPSTDHLCPRLLLHAPTLESLALRNVHLCSDLFCTAWPQLRVLYTHFVNAIPGLCRSQCNSPYWSSAEWDAWRATTATETDALRGTLEWMFNTHPKLANIGIIMCNEAFDERGCAHLQSVPLARRDHRGQAINRIEVWRMVWLGFAVPPPPHDGGPDDGGPDDGEETDYEAWTDSEIEEEEEEAEVEAVIRPKQLKIR